MKIFVLPTPIFTEQRIGQKSNRLLIELRKKVEKMKVKKPTSKKDKCYICGRQNHLTLHHLIPKSLGGSDAPSNLVCLCENCHAKLHLLISSLVQMLQQEQQDK